MADSILRNIATATGTYNEISTALESLASVVITTDGLVITMTADKEVWATGVLTYTVTIENTALYPFVTPVLTDTLPTDAVTLVDGSITVNGEATTDYTYDAGTGLLSVNLATIETEQTAVVTFQVSKV